LPDEATSEAWLCADAFEARTAAGGWAAGAGSGADIVVGAAGRLTGVSIG
jgi:hypothetical protein